MAVSPGKSVASAGGPGASRGNEDADEDAGPGLMDRAELKAMLTLAKGKPVGCAIALTRDKQPLLLLHRTMRPRQVLAQLRKQATDGGMALDTTSLRFGRATVDGASDGQQLGIAVNKPVPNEAAYARKLRGLVKPVGCRRCSLSVDESLDTDGGDEDVVASGAGGTAQGGAAADSAPETGPAGLPGFAAAPVDTTSAPAVGIPPSSRPGLAASATTQAPGTDGNGAAPDATVPAARAALTAIVPPDLAVGLRAALSAGPERKGELAGLLAQVRAGVDRGDPAAAEAGIAALRKAVGAPAQSLAAAHPAAPDQARDASPRLGVRDVATAPPVAVPEPPALAADAGLSSLARAWEAEQARAKQEMGQDGTAPDGAPPAVGQPSPTPALPTSGIAQRVPDPAQVRADVAAMMHGMDRGRAEGVSGGVQVAQAGPPGATTATDAGGPEPVERDRMTHWGSLPRPDSEPFPGAVRSAPDWRPLQGLGQVVLGAGGLAAGGALLAAGAGEAGIGIVTTPAGGVGIPVAAAGVATMGLGAAVGGGGAVMANEGMGNILAPFRDPRPLPPPGVLPAQDQAATADAARRWLADNPAPGAAGSPAPAPASLMPPLPGLEPLPEEQRRALGQNVLFPANPDTGRGSVVSTPIPVGSPVPQHTGEAPPVLPPGMNIVETQGDPGLTRPTGPIGGVPTGLRPVSKAGAPPEDKARVDSELHVGGAFAAAGYRTEEQPTRGPNAATGRKQMLAEGLNPRKNPDLRIEGRIWDIYTPDTSDPAGIRRGIKDKIDAEQTHRVAVDLRGVGQTEAAVRAALRADPVPGLKEIAVITEDGFTHPFRP